MKTELTPAEYSLIQAARAEQEAKAIAHTKALGEARIKAKTEAESEAARRTAEWKKMADATKDYFLKFGDGWELKETTRIEPIVRKVELKWEKEPRVEVEHRLDVEIKTYTIVNGRFTVSVHEHITWRGTGWRATKVNNGFKMFLSGPGVDEAYQRKALINPVTIMTKVKFIIDSEKAAREQNENAQKAKAKTVQILSDKFPTATITEDVGYEWGTQMRQRYQYHRATIVFPNGITLVLTLYNDGSFNITSTLFPETVTQMGRVEALSNLSF